MTRPPANDTTPETGAGSVARFGARLLAFLVDAALSVAVAIVSGYRPPSSGYNLVVYGAFLAIELLFVSIAGQTPGMRVAGVVVVRSRDGGKPQPHWVLVRTILLAAIAPALITDARGRAMHDRASGLSTLRTR
jgi:uncharacterized RDD family membrane protein YckC